MNQTTPQRSLPELGPLIYLLLCVLALAAIFLAQLQQGLFLSNALAVMIGALGLVSRLRLGPILLLLAVAGAQLLQRRTQGGFMAPRFQGTTFQTYELQLAVGVLAYVAGHFRLQGLWHEIVPRDVRQRVGPAKPYFFTGEMIKPVAVHKRASRHLSPAEIIWFLLSLGIWVLLGQLLWLWLAPPRNTLDMPGYLWQMLVLASTAFVGALVSRQLLLQWSYRQMTPAQARLTLQDILWQETRGDQRRLNRWLKWREMKRKKPG